MKLRLWMLPSVLVLFMLAGCVSYSSRITKLELGMSPQEARKAMGADPTTRRAAKLYEDGQKTEIWEYLAKYTFNPKNYWLYFENDKLVQWGEPGDFAGKSGMNVPVEEYKPFKK